MMRLPLRYRGVAASDGERPEEGAKALARARRTSAVVYRMRLVLYVYNGIAWPLVAPEFFDGGVIWGLWIGLHAVWPHLAYLVSRRLADPLRTERIAIALETAIIGCVVNELGYLVWYAFSALSASLISAIAFGGDRTLFAAILMFLIGTVLWGLLRGFELAVSPSTPVEIVGALGGAIPLLLTAQANFRMLNRLSRGRRETQQRNRQYQAMMEMSAALRNTSDTDTLIGQALSDFTQLLPEFGFGVILREPQRPSVVRHAAFRGVDEDLAGTVVRAVTRASGDHDIAGPATLPVGGEGFDILPLTPHLQQLQGFLIVRGSIEDDELMTMLHLFGEQMASALESNLLTLRLDWLANTDGLTGLHNRAYFDRQMAHSERNRTGPAATPFSVIMIDLNGLKAINDTYGHEAGDEMIRLAARMLEGVVRSCDVLARFGGDEFVILANDCDSATVREIVARIEAHVQDQSVETTVSDGDRLVMQISLSLGAAGSDEAEGGELLELADRRMYDNKRRFYGRTMPDQ